MIGCALWSEGCKCKRSFLHQSLRQQRAIGVTGNVNTFRVNRIGVFNTAQYIVNVFHIIGLRVDIQRIPRRKRHGVSTTNAVIGKSGNINQKKTTPFG